MSEGTGRLGRVAGLWWLLGSLVALAAGSPDEVRAQNQQAQNQQAQNQQAQNQQAQNQDRVEFLSGATLEGKVLAIRKDQKEFDFSTEVGGRTFKRTYPYAKVHAVTIKGQRYVLTPKSASGSGRPAGIKPGAGNAAPSNRSPKQLRDLIESAGNTPPDWFESTQLNYPQTLDLSWPLKAEGPWNGNKNVGQHIWDTVNPNESRWHAGIKLVHHCMTLHEDDPVLLDRDMEKLGEMYFTLLQDYPRAAFWLQKAKVTAAKGTGVHLAECYWRLGSRKLALDMLRNRTLNVAAIKLLGDMGEVDRALQLTQVYSRTNLSNQALLAAGDALRKAGRQAEAIRYFERALNATDYRNKEYENRLKARARASIEAVRLQDQLDLSRVAEGTYNASSIGYNGDVQVEVRVASGRIESVRVTGHREKQFYAALTDTPRQIMERQGIGGIDGTSGATITSQAIVHATAKAVAQGIK